MLLNVEATLNWIEISEMQSNFNAGFNHQVEARTSQIHFPFTQIFSLKAKYTEKRNIFTLRDILLEGRNILSLREIISRKYFCKKEEHTFFQYWEILFQTKIISSPSGKYFYRGRRCGKYFHRNKEIFSLIRKYFYRTNEIFSLIGKSFYDTMWGPAMKAFPKRYKKSDGLQVQLWRVGASQHEAWDP